MNETAVLILAAMVPILTISFIVFCIFWFLVRPRERIVFNLQSKFNGKSLGFFARYHGFKGEYNNSPFVVVSVPDSGSRAWVRNPSYLEVSLEKSSYFKLSIYDESYGVPGLFVFLAMSQIVKRVEAGDVGLSKDCAIFTDNSDMAQVYLRDTRVKPIVDGFIGAWGRGYAMCIDNRRILLRRYVSDIVKDSSAEVVEELLKKLEILSSALHKFDGYALRNK